MGLLDNLFAQQGYGLFGGNYPSTIFHQPEEAQAAREAAAATLARRFGRRSPQEQPQASSIFDTGAGGVFGVDPNALPVPQQVQQQMPASGLGSLAPPAGPQQPGPPQQPQAPQANVSVSSINRPQAPPIQQSVGPPLQIAPQSSGPGASEPNMFSPNGTSIFDRINAGFQSIGNGGSIIGALTGNHTDPVTDQRKSQRAIYDAALQSGLDKNKAFLVATNPKAFEAYAQQLLGAKDPPKTVEELAVRNAWEKRGAGSGGVGGLPTTLEGLQEYKANEKAREAGAKVKAEEQAKLQVSLPDTLARSRETIKQIDELKGHSAKGYRTGFPSILPGIPGTPGVDFDERVKQIKGAAFLDAYKMLRGTGAISEAEGIKAEQAQARLAQAKSPGDFDKALDDLRQVVVEGYARAQQMAGSDTVEPYQMPIGQPRNIGGVTIKRIK
jgi:hypothetical protein